MQHVVSLNFEKGIVSPLSQSPFKPFDASRISKDSSLSMLY